MTKEQALALANARLRMQQRQAGMADMQRMADPTSGMGFLDKFNAGMGKAFTDIGRGAAQMVGMGPSAEETRETRRLDAPLMKTGGGIAGNVAGNIVAFAPAAMIPGANTVAGAGAVGSTIGALQPTESAQERMYNMGMGGALGAGTQALAGPVARAVGERAGAKEAALKMKQAQNATRDATLREAQAAGYRVPPSAVNPSILNRTLESIAGKDQTKQAFASHNQEVTNRLARKALGMADDAPLSEQSLKAFRQAVGKPYRDVAALSDEAALALESLKNARFQAKEYSNFYKRSGDPKALMEARNYQGAADMFEQVLESEATKAGKPELINALRESRKQMAKSFEVEGALNLGSGDVSTKALGRALDKGKPLSGELATAGKFAEAFGPYAIREGDNRQVSKLQAYMGALLAGGGAMTAGFPGATAGALPFVVPQVAKSVVTSAPYQRLMATPNYEAGLLTRGASLLADPETQRRVALAARGLLLPAIPQFVNE